MTFRVWIGKFGNVIAVGHIVVVFVLLEIEVAFVIILRVGLFCSISELIKERFPFFLESKTSFFLNHCSFTCSEQKSK